MAKRGFATVGLLLALAAAAGAQDLPGNELQVNFSTYFDNFNVTIVYPDFSLTRKISETTSLTGRYLVDMVTAASIRSAGNGGRERGDDDDIRIDAVTAASGRAGESLGPSFDDVRQEFSGGITHQLANSLLSVNGIYSTENDYTSGTLAGTWAQAFAKKNTTVQLGFVRSWDKVFPVTKTWRRDKNVLTYSANFSQILSLRLISQFIFTYTEESGQLSDDYKQVTINGQVFDPVHPGLRIRRAAAGRLKYRLNERSAVQLGYRYYWDDWDVTSHTFSGLYQRHIAAATTIGAGFRSYFQSRAFFFKPAYRRPELYMSVDDKLDSGFSNELQFELTVDGGEGRDYLPFLENENVQYNFSVNWYWRHTDSPDWFSRLNDLVALYFNIGIRYRF